MSVRHVEPSRSALRSVDALPTTRQRSRISASCPLAPQMTEARRLFKTERFNINAGGSEEALSHFGDQ